MGLLASLLEDATRWLELLGAGGSGGRPRGACSPEDKPSIAPAKTKMTVDTVIAASADSRGGACPVITCDHAKFVNQLGWRALRVLRSSVSCCDETRTFLTDHFFARSCSVSAKVPPKAAQRVLQVYPGRPIGTIEEKNAQRLRFHAVAQRLPLGGNLDAARV